MRWREERGEGCTGQEREEREEGLGEMLLESRTFRPTDTYMYTLVHTKTYVCVHTRTPSLLSLLSLGVSGQCPPGLPPS